MRRLLQIAGMLLAWMAAIAPPNAQAPSFDVATIKATPPDFNGGMFETMRGRQYTVRNYTARDLLVTAFRLHRSAVFGGPTWIETDKYDIDAVTSGDELPSRDARAVMLRELLRVRFNLAVHLEEREVPLYALVVAKNGPKLKASAAENKSVLAPLVNRVFPNRIVTEGRAITVNQLASLLQIDRPVVDRTGITGMFDFDVEWVPDAQFNGRLILPAPDTSKPGLFTALQEQIGLRLEPTRGPGQVLIIDRIERPTEN
jgi:uncharacterized protein (TIGR03435 family)